MQSKCNPIAYDPDTEFMNDFYPFRSLWKQANQSDHENE